MNLENDILLIDKPEDWTSFDVVAKIRNVYRKATNNKKAKVGHAGTLDPFATGLLIVLLGQATKKQDQFMKLDKEYEATLRLGATSTTGDPEGEISGKGCTEINEGKIDQVLHHFIGEIKQIPHQFSAIKINGKRAYQLAREGKDVEIEPRKVTIFEIERVNFTRPDLEIRVKCSSGTYIRSLAEDIGKELGCGAYLTKLRRTQVGQYKIEGSLSIKEAINNIDILA